MNTVQARNELELWIKRFLTFSKLTQPNQITLDDVRDFQLYLNQQDNGRFWDWACKHPWKWSQGID